MMKKLSKLFIVLIFMLIPNVVFAAEYNHIYLVEDFTIGSNAVITINGYSFVSHMDNYGIYNGKGNLKTRIIAYTGTWNDNYADVNTCNNSTNCYVIDTTNELQNGIASDKVRDFWPARCTDSACFEKVDVFDYRIKNGFSKSCSGMTTVIPGGGASGSHCLYYNVGFKTKITLESLYKNFGEKEVNFKIIPYIDGIPWKSTNSNAYSDFSVYHKYCNNSGNSCKDIANTVDAYSLDITGLSDTVYFDAVGVLARNSDGKVVDDSEPKFKSGVEYKVLNFISNGTYTKTVGGSYVGEFSDSLLNLASEKFGGAIVPTRSLISGYYAYANYVKFSGAIKMKTKLNVIKESCKSWDKSAYKKSSIIVNCGEERSLNQCQAFDNVMATIYVKSDSSCVNVGDNKKVKVGDAYYIPIDVSTNVLIKQRGEFNFGSVSPKTLVAGKGFSLGNVTYNNEITWINANRTSTGSPYYRYSTERYVSSGGSCVKDEDFSFKNIGVYYYYDGNGDFRTTSTIEDAALKAIDVKVNSSYINDAVDSVSEKIKFKSCDSNNSKGCNKDNVNTEVNGVWKKTSSNKGVENLNYNNKNFVFGYKLSNKYSYGLYDSYVALRDVVYGGKSYKAGNVMYGTGLGEIDGFFKSKKYYVDLNYDSNKYPFNLKKNNPSLIKGMDWTLDGVCSVDVNSPGDPDDPDNPPKIRYKFRSISLSSPFPKANSDFSNIAINWREWYKIKDNFERIQNTYANGINYSIIISNYPRAGYFSISDINNEEGNYSELNEDNFYLDGRSKFVDVFFGTNNGKKLVSTSNKVYYCGLGKFSEDCNDLYFGG